MKSFAIRSPGDDTVLVNLAVRLQSEPKVEGKGGSRQQLKSQRMRSILVAQLPQGC